MWNSPNTKPDLNFCFSFFFIKKNNLFISWLTLFSARLRFRNCVVVVVFRATARARESARACATEHERERKRPRAPSARERESLCKSARETHTQTHTELSWLLLSQGTQESRVFWVRCIPIPTCRNLELQTRHSKCWRRCFPTCSVQLLCYVYWRRSCFFCCSAGDRHEELLLLQKAETCGSMMMSCSNSALGDNNCLQVQWVCHSSEKPCTTAGAWKLLSQLSWLIIARSKSCAVVEELQLPKNHEV